MFTSFKREIKPKMYPHCDKNIPALIVEISDQNPMLKLLPIKMKKC